MFAVKPDISAPSSPWAKDSPLQYICTGEGNTLLSSPSLLWGDTRPFRKAEFEVSQQPEEPMPQQHIVGRPGSCLRQIDIQNMLCNCVFGWNGAPISSKFYLLLLETTQGNVLSYKLSKSLLGSRDWFCIGWRDDIKEQIYTYDHICLLKQRHLYICRHKTKQNNIL